MADAFDCLPYPPTPSWFQVFARFAGTVALILLLPSNSPNTLDSYFADRASEKETIHGVSLPNLSPKFSPACAPRMSLCLWRHPFPPLRIPSEIFGQIFSHEVHLLNYDVVGSYLPHASCSIYLLGCRETERGISHAAGPCHNKKSAASLSVGSSLFPGTFILNPSMTCRNTRDFTGMSQWCRL
jgi:hypothetical protein